MDRLDFIDSDVHVCVVADAVVPNLSPALDRGLGCKKVVLIHTANYKNQAQRLAKALSQYQIKAEYYEIKDAFDIEYLSTAISKLFLRLIDMKPLVNISVGTKPISIVMHEQARALEFPIYYLNRDDTLSWIWPEKQAKYALEDRIKAKPFLYAHGLTLLDDQQPNSNKSYRVLLDDIVENITYFKKAISQLNYYAFTAGRNLTSAPISGDVSVLRELIALFEKLGLAELKNDKIHFKNEVARFFANGGWLEEFLYHQIRQLSSQDRKIHDNLMSVEVESENGVKNEIDNLVLFDNNLHLIECKTKRFKDDGKPDGGAVQSIYKLETLMDELGGPLAKGMFVSLYPLSQADLQRAKQYNIEVVALEELQNIKARLSSWMNASR